MTFCIITHVNHTNRNGHFYAYAPYTDEMNIWIKNADKVIVTAPLDSFEPTQIHAAYQHNNIDFVVLQPFHTLGILAVLRSLVSVPFNVWRIFRAMKKADHIHLRCPGNIGLLGCFVQILFPKKTKTAKYAGNWDPTAKQPLSYRLQKWLLSNSFLTKNMQVLVYGQWSDQSKNIKPFFTATYPETEKTAVFPGKQEGIIQFLFVGTLTAGKQPLYAIKLLEKLNQNGIEAALSVYGEGPEKNKLEQYTTDNGLSAKVTLQGNRDKATIKKAYQQSHFLILPSKSEGWPKVVAEAMFWGCLPIASKVSCVPFILGQGNRGILLTNDLVQDVKQITALIDCPETYDFKVKDAIDWSRQYTTDVFEEAIKKMMRP